MKIYTYISWVHPPFGDDYSIETKFEVNSNDEKLVERLCKRSIQNTLKKYHSEILTDYKLESIVEK